VSPQYHNADLGDDVIFKCDSRNKTTWSHTGSYPPISTGVLKERMSWIIKNVTIEGRGQYVCQGYDEDNYAFKAIGVLNVHRKLLV